MDNNKNNKHIIPLYAGNRNDIPFDVKYYIHGIGRRKINDVYEYYYIKDDTIVNKKDQDRINKLRIPPSWDKVWVSGDHESAIQATGIDIKGRKQYRYHEVHIEQAEKRKFIRLYDFIKAIPKLEKAMNVHMTLKPYDKYRVIASMLQIVRELHMRVGKEVYARKNKSYGVSSLRKIHMNIDGDTITFRFKGKSNKRLSYTIKDRELATHLKLLLRLEGDHLFQYIDADNWVRNVTDTDLNQYIQIYMGEQFTVKDFRSYAANYYFTKTLLTETKKRLPKNNKIIKKNILQAFKSTVFYLRHTRSISKKSYVMNFTIDMYYNNPEYFIKRKDEDPDDVLLHILQLYKRQILNI